KIGSEHLQLLLSVAVTKEGFGVHVIRTVIQIYFVVGINMIRRVSKAHLSMKWKREEVKKTVITDQPTSHITNLYFSATFSMLVLDGMDISFIFFLRLYSEMIFIRLSDQKNRS